MSIQPTKHSLRRISSDKTHQKRHHYTDSCTRARIMAPLTGSARFYRADYRWLRVESLHCIFDIIIPARAPPSPVLLYDGRVDKVSYKCTGELIVNIIVSGEARSDLNAQLVQRAHTPRTAAADLLALGGQDIVKFQPFGIPRRTVTYMATRIDAPSTGALSLLRSKTRSLDP